MEINEESFINRRHRLESTYQMNGYLRFWYFQYKFINKLPSPLKKTFNLIYSPYCMFISLDIPFKTKIGYGFKITHSNGIVINENSVIGNNVWVRCNTCIGNSLKTNDAPVIGDNVEIGANVTIIGKVTIGRNSIIGAGAVVIKDVPPCCIVAGNPARIIKVIK